MAVIDDIKKKVEKYFEVYDVRWDYDSIAYICNVNEGTLDRDFDALRLELKKDSFIPMLIHEGGEYIVFVTKRADVSYKSINVNILMFFLTICTTVFVGAMNWSAYDPAVDTESNWLNMFSLRAIAYGALFFAAPLMTILGIHELGHFFMARRHHVAASWPFFIPVPFPPLGTFGAFISMREPIPDKRALMDIGAAGPIAGFCVAVPMTLLGIWLTDLWAVPVPKDAGGLVYLGNSLFFGIISESVPSGPYLMHPTALAGWVGLLVTFLNLLPAGQLDGGHIMRALFGDRAKFVSYLVIFMMLIFAVDVPTFKNPYYGWFVFVFIILFLGISHPPPLNDRTPLDVKRYFVGFVCLSILAGCFVKVPLEQADQHNDVWMELEKDLIIAEPNETLNFTVRMYNYGNVRDQIRYNIEDADDINKDGWTVSLSEEKHDVYSGKTKEMKPTHNRTVKVHVSVPANAGYGDERAIGFRVKSELDGKRWMTLETHVVVGKAVLDLRRPAALVVPGEENVLDILVKANAPGDMTANLTIESPPGWEIGATQWHFVFSDMPYQREQWVLLNVIVPNDVDPAGIYNLTIALEIDGNSSLRDARVLPVALPGPHSVFLNVEPAQIKGGPGETVQVAVGVRGLSSNQTTVSVNVNASDGIILGPATGPSLTLGPYGTSQLLFNVTLPDEPGNRGWIEFRAVPTEAPDKAQRVLVDVRVG